MSNNAPLNYEASAGQTHLRISDTLPSEVVQCLKNARFLHLATCTSDLRPHVSLMNYTYLPSTPYSSHPAIIMTTNPASRKTLNLISNPNVSLLVHDWVSHRPPTSRPDRASSPSADGSRSSLAMLLANLNTSALSSISATINGSASLVERGTEEERYLREQHLENNTFETGGDGTEAGMIGMLRRRESVGGEMGDGGRGAFVEGEDVRVLMVRITDGRVADWKGNVRDWRLEGSSAPATEAGVPMVNGIR